MLQLSSYWHDFLSNIDFESFECFCWFTSTLPHFLLPPPKEKNVYLRDCNGNKATIKIFRFIEFVFVILWRWKKQENKKEYFHGNSRLVVSSVIYIDQSTLKRQFILNQSQTGNSSAWFKLFPKPYSSYLKKVNVSVISHI